MIIPHLPDHHASIATGVDGYSTSQWRVLTQCTRRGVYTLGGTTLETGDPFGVYTITLEDATSSTLAVMPPIISLPAFRIQASGWTGDGKPSRYSLEETINASHTREMQPNDPMRLIHWKTTARHAAAAEGSGGNKFFVRQSEGTPAGDWWIVLDLHQASQLGRGWDSTEEHSIILTSSLAAQGLNEQHPTGIAINGGEADWIAPRRNEYQLRSLLKALAVATPSDIQLKDYLQRIGPSLSSHSSLLVITACADPTWTESLLPLMWRGIIPNVFVLDPVTYGGETSAKAVEDAMRLMARPVILFRKKYWINNKVTPGTKANGNGVSLPPGRPLPCAPRRKNGGACNDRTLPAERLHCRDHWIAPDLDRLADFDLRPGWLFAKHRHRLFFTGGPALPRCWPWD